MRQRIVVQLQQPERRVGADLRVRHTLIVVRVAETPTGSAELLPRPVRRVAAWPDDRDGANVPSRKLSRCAMPGEVVALLPVPAAEERLTPT